MKRQFESLPLSLIFKTVFTQPFKNQILMLLPVVLQSGAIILQALHGKPVFIRNENGDVKEAFISFPLHGLPHPPWMESWEERLALIKEKC